MSREAAQPVSLRGAEVESRAVSGQRPRVSVIVPVLNSKPYLETCLDSIIAAMKRYGSSELVVVDNGSTDGSYELLLEKYLPFAKISQIKGCTIGFLRNSGARASSGEYICFIDSDCVIPEDYLERVVDVFSSVDTDAAGCMVRPPVPPHWIEQTWQELHQHRGDGYVSFINSGNFAIKRSVFDRTTGFSESLVTGEDSEYCLRLVAGGYKIYESQRIAVAHLRNPKTLASFFRKNVWHGLGMFGSLRFSLLDKPLWMTVFFLLLTIAGLVICFLGPGNWWVRIGALALCSFFVPSVTVLYRAVQSGRLPRPIRSVFLYWLYYAARVYALCVIWFRGVQHTASRVARSA